MLPLTDDLSPDDRRVLADVEQYGYHVVHVPDDEVGPGYSFTIGLWHHFQQPEVIVFGMPMDLARELIDLIAEETGEGQRFVAGSESRDLLVGHAVRFVGVPADRFGEYLGYARWAYDGEAFEAVQLIWPDDRGRWPWDDGVDPGYRALQPLLDRAPE